ncbi:MAG: hypothetical protein ACOX2P_00240 [Bacillota bacterium]|jgi:hypothetical protein
MNIIQEVQKIIIKAYQSNLKKHWPLIPNGLAKFCPIDNTLNNAAFLKIKSPVLEIGHVGLSVMLQFPVPIVETVFGG